MFSVILRSNIRNIFTFYFVTVTSNALPSPSSKSVHCIWFHIVFKCLMKGDEL